MWSRNAGRKGGREGDREKRKMRGIEKLGDTEKGKIKE